MSCLKRKLNINMIFKLSSFSFSLSRYFGVEMKPYINKIEEMDVANRNGSHYIPLSALQRQPPSPSHSGGSSQAGTTSKKTRRIFPETDIMRIVSSGFTRNRAIKELEKCDGNTDVALVRLLGRTIHFEDYSNEPCFSD